MTFTRDPLRLVLALALLFTAAVGAPASGIAAGLPGTGSLSGSVAGGEPLQDATVYAFNAQRSIGYMVYVVGGRYRATTLFPGDYEVSLRGVGLESKPVNVKVVAGAAATADFTARRVPAPKQYAGGMAYPDASIEPYEKIYPPGPGRDVMERTCMACHTVQFFAYNALRTYPGGRTPKDAEGWAITVDRMSGGSQWGVPGKPSYFDAALLTPADREALIAYLAKNFGADAPPRLVEKPPYEVPRDERALAKAMFIEYRMLNAAGQKRHAQQIDFDRDGNVWVTDRGLPGLVKVDPRTGERKDYPGHGGGHGLAVDLDGTIWYSGDVVRRFDPQSDLHDAYLIAGDKAPGSNTQIWDSNGNLWLSLLTTSGLGMWDRKTDTILRWEVPTPRSRPYGIVVDHKDRVWMGGYHDSGVEMFDPATGQFRHYPLTRDAPTNIRRPGADSKNMIWAATWGSPGMMKGALYRLNPDSGEVMERRLGIPFTNPYCAEADEFDNIWVSTDNHLAMYDQKADRFTFYPLPTRTDIPKVTIARGGAIWFGPRNAGNFNGYGASASVLYPDMDRIETLGAYFHPQSTENRLSLFKGAAAPKVAGVYKVSPVEFQSGVGVPKAPAPGIIGRTKRDDDVRRLE